MPTLNWIGKEAVEKHHLDIPYRLLEYDESFSAGNQESGNLLIQGDNLQALKALLPYYAGKVKCIYIDPPYNTGKENWRYNDNVNSPEIKEWLNKTVGNEEEDFTRHDKWLCMMYPRLNLLKKFLSNDGLIFVSIDDEEISNLKVLCDDIFQRKNRIADLVWDLGTGTSAGHFTRSHEYILCYAKNKLKLPNFTGGKGEIDDRSIKKISKKNPASNFTFKAGIRVQSEKDFELSGSWGRNEIVSIISGNWICENGKLKEEVTLSAGWTQKNQMESWFNGNETFDSKGQKVIEFYFRENGKVYCRKSKEILNPPTILRGIGSTRSGSSSLKTILNSEEFDFPKAPDLIKYLISLATTGSSLILDSFAGSGTTGHSVLELNNNTNGKRNFILIEIEEDIAKSVAAERLKKLILGYDIYKKNGKIESVKGIGGGFRYCRLGYPIFDKYGNINERVKFKELAYHVFFSETGTPLKENLKLDTPLIGKYKGTAYYLLYNGILKDKSVSGGNVLTSNILKSLPKYKGNKIVFGLANRLSDTKLKNENIIFKQIPVEIKTS